MTIEAGARRTSVHEQQFAVWRSVFIGPDSNAVIGCADRGFVQRFWHRECGFGLPRIPPTYILQEQGGR